MSPILLSLRFCEKGRTFMLKANRGAGKIEWQPSLEVDSRILDLGEADQLTVENLDPSGVVIPDTTATVIARFEVPGLEWRVSVTCEDSGRTAVVSATVQNNGTAVRCLGKCSFVRVTPTSGSLNLGTDAPDLVFISFTGDQGLNHVKRLTADGGRHRVKHIAHLHDRASKETLHLGFVTFDRINTEHTFACHAEGSLTELNSYCDFFGFELQPGATVDTETLVIELATNPYVSLERWADRVHERYQPPIPSRCPAGWVGWSWVDGFNVEEYESVVLRNARALRERLAGFEFDYIWVSIGNLEGGLPGNWLKFNTKLFPGGVENLVSRLGELDLKLGFWMAPFWVCSHATDIVEDLRDCLLRDEEGNLLVTCAEWQYGDAAKLPRGQRPGCYALDGSHPRAVEFLRQVFRVYREWGVRYYMIDFLHAGSGIAPGGFPYSDYYDHSMVKGPQVYRNALEAVREAAGPDTYLLCSSGPTILDTGIVNAARVGNDYGEGRALYPETYFYPATFVINGPDFWTSHRYATTNMAANYFTHRKLYLNDSGNVMTVDKPVPLCEAQITATVFGINGGPMMIGDDVDRMSEERLSLIRKCLPRGEEVPFPVDLFDSPAPDYPKVFHLRVEREWDQWDLVAVFNYDDQSRTHTLGFARLGLAPDQFYQVWEFWNEQYLGAHSDSLEVCMPPRSARVHRLLRRREHPWLLSTDMHVRQGQFEILDCRWNADSMTLSGHAARPAGEVGNLFVTVPPGLRLEDPQGLWIAKDAHDQTLIVRKELRFGEESASFELSFAPVAGT